MVRNDHTFQRSTCNSDSIYTFDRRNLGQTNFPARHGKTRMVEETPEVLVLATLKNVSEGESYICILYIAYIIIVYVYIYIYFDIITYIFICRPIHTYPNYIFLC